MKKLHLITAIALFGLLTVNAQEVKFGIKGGINFTTVLGTDYEGLKTSFHFGAASEIILSDNFSVQPELLYSSQGSRYEETYEFLGFIEEEKVDIDLNYLNIPIMAKFYPVGGFNIEAGPQIGFLLSAKTDFSFNENGDITSGSDDLKDHLKGIDLGLNLGLGYKFTNGFNLGARYTFALTDINDSSNADFMYTNSKLTNMVAQFSVGFFFN